MKAKKLFSMISALLVISLFSALHLEIVSAWNTSHSADNAIAKSLSPSEIRKLIPALDQADDLLIRKEVCGSNAFAGMELAAQTGTDYGYQDMKLRSNPEGREKLYQKLMSSMESVWDSEEDSVRIENINLGVFYIMDIFILEDYGLTFEEAGAVYETFRHDNPVFYYASNVFLGFPASDTQTYIILTCYDDFYEQSVKQKYNAKIQPYIDSYASCVKGKSAYSDAKAIHDKLILSMDYALADDGFSASETGTAHSVIGAIEGAGTCDTYAKTLQLLYTYYGIESIFVTGTVNSGHAWNLVKLDDGKYYFIDATGDDSGDTVSYQYFAVGTNTLSKTHTLHSTANTGSDFLYALPEISPSDYVSTPMQIQGDINDDGKRNVADVILLQKWLSAVPDTQLSNWKVADLCKDEKLNVNDLCFMKRFLIYEDTSV